MSMMPAGCPPQIVVYDNSSQSLEEVDTSPDEVGFNIEVIDSRVEEQANPSHNELTLSNEQEQVVEANISVNGIIKEQQEQLAWNELSIDQLRSECRKRKIKNVRQNSRKETLIRYLKEFEKAVHHP